VFSQNTRIAATVDEGRAFALIVCLWALWKLRFVSRGQVVSNPFITFVNLNTNA
jgi:hypothetical protein